MGIENRWESIDRVQNETDKIENKTEELEREAAELNSLNGSITVPEGCEHIKDSVKNAVVEAIDSYASSEIIAPAGGLEKQAADLENEASQDLSNLKNTENTIDIIKSNEKNIHIDLDGAKAETHEMAEITDDQTGKSAELRHQMVDSTIRTDRIKNIIR